MAPTIESCPQDRSAEMNPKCNGHSLSLSYQGISVPSLCSLRTSCAHQQGVWAETVHSFIGSGGCVTTASSLGNIWLSPAFRIIAFFLSPFAVQSFHICGMERGCADGGRGGAAGAYDLDQHVAMFDNIGSWWRARLTLFPVACFPFKAILFRHGLCRMQIAAQDPFLRDHQEEFRTKVAIEAPNYPLWHTSACDWFFSEVQLIGYSH